MDGWIKLHRQIKEHWIWEDPAYLKAWLGILLTVNYENKKVLIQGELIECNRGQSLLSLAGWAKLFGKKWTIQRVRTFLELLKRNEMITTEGLRKTTRLTVCNFDSYQFEQQTDNTQITRRQQTDNTQITTNKKEKERIKKEKNEKNEVIGGLPPFPPLPKNHFDFNSIVEHYHQKCPGMPRVTILNDSRKNTIKARLNEVGPEGVLKMIQNAGSSEFLNGKNERSWIASFDWLFKPTNFAKVLEGNYLKINSNESYKPNDPRASAVEGFDEPL